VRLTRFELVSSSWQPEILPLYHSRISGAGRRTRTDIRCLEGRSNSLYTIPAYLLKEYSVRGEFLWSSSSSFFQFQRALLTDPSTLLIALFGHPGALLGICFCVRGEQIYKPQIFYQENSEKPRHLKLSKLIGLLLSKVILRTRFSLC
jgi:hypothetical protein